MHHNTLATKEVLIAAAKTKKPWIIALAIILLSAPPIIIWRRPGGHQSPQLLTPAEVAADPSVRRKMLSFVNDKGEPVTDLTVKLVDTAANFQVDYDGTITVDAKYSGASIMIYYNVPLTLILVTNINRSLGPHVIVVRKKTENRN